MENRVNEAFVAATAEQLPVGVESSPGHRVAVENPPLLRDEHDGRPTQFADTVGRTNPVRVFLAAIVAVYAILVGLAVAAGLALTDLLVPVDRFERWDNGINRCLANHRSGTLEDASWVG